MSDIAWGVVIGFLAMFIILFVMLHAYPNNSVSNRALNDPKYKIDTTMTVTNGDTTYTYKFARK